MRSGYSLFSLLHFPANSSQVPHKCSCALGHSALTDWPLQGVWWRRLIRGEEMVEACNIDTSISSLAKARASCMIPKNSPILPANTGSTCSSHGAGDAMATDMFSGYGAKDQDAEAMNRHRIIDLLFAVGAHTICTAHTSYAPSFECMPSLRFFLWSGLGCKVVASTVSRTLSTQPHIPFSRSTPKDNLIHAARYSPLLLI